MQHDKLRRSLSLRIGNISRSLHSHRALSTHDIIERNSARTESEKAAATIQQRHYQWEQGHPFSRKPVELGDLDGKEAMFTR